LLLPGYRVETAHFKTTSALDAFFLMDEVGRLALAGNTPDGTVAGAHGAADTFIGHDFIMDEGPAFVGGALFVHHMGFIFIAESA
jgi:hypothetical protein